jgi:hypothetical protein
MCPACIAAVMAVVGVVSAGGGAAVVVGRRRGKTHRTDRRSGRGQEERRD